jgi:hypothetical protein
LAALPRLCRVAPRPRSNRHPPTAASRAKSSFANVWQISLDFANVWQNLKTARRVDLPMFGKNGSILPNIGKTGGAAGKLNGGGVDGVLPCFPDWCRWEPG